MCNPVKWIWGLLPLALLAVATLWVKSETIEDDLASRTNAERRDANHSWARVAMDGRDLTLSGTAPTEAAQAEMTEIATNIYGVRVVNEQTDLLPLQSPYTLRAERTEEGVALTGFAPNSDAKKQLVADAKANFPAGKVTDELELARGAPAGDWNVAMAYGLGQLAKMSAGSMSVADADITITGMAADRASYTDLSSTISAPELPAGFSLVDSAVELPVASPFVWSAQYTTGALQISGHVPSETQQASLLDAASRKFANLDVSDASEIVGGAPPNWSSAASIALQLVSRLQSGQATLSDTSLNVTGEAAHQAAAEAINRNLANALPPGYTGSAEISVATAGDPVGSNECQVDLDEIMSGGKILFDVGKATISDDSMRIVDSIVGVARRCTSSRIVVGGHTDSDGDDQANRRLSEDRAEAVREAIIAGGIDASRLLAIGYGETQPLGTNDTDEGKAANRRIEFRVFAN